MKKYIFRFCSFIIITILTLSLFSCGDSYRNDVKTETIATAIAEKLTLDDGYSVSDSDSFKYNFNEPSYVDDYTIMYAKSSTNVNRFGVFHVSDSKSVEAMQQIVEDYVQKYKDNFNYDYLPLENPKIENGKVIVYGNYVVFMFLNEADQSTADIEILNLLEK